MIKSYVSISLSSFIGNLLAYFDRLLLNPLLGAAAVSTFSVASFWGRSIGFIIIPAASVFLSYLTQKGFIITKEKYLLLSGLSLLPLALMMLIGIKMGPILTKFLYPSLFLSADEYIFLASLGILIGYGTDLFVPVILSICNTKKILILQLIYFFVYISFAIYGSKYSGLKGFCIALCIINTIKYILYFFTGLINYKNKKLNIVNQ